MMTRDWKYGFSWLRWESSCSNQAQSYLRQRYNACCWLMWSSCMSCCSIYWTSCLLDESISSLAYQRASLFSFFSSFLIFLRLYNNCSLFCSIRATSRYKQYLQAQDSTVQRRSLVPKRRVDRRLSRDFACLGSLMSFLGLLCDLRGDSAASFSLLLNFCFCFRYSSFQLESNCQLLQRKVRKRALPPSCTPSPSSLFICCFVFGISCRVASRWFCRSNFLLRICCMFGLCGVGRVCSLLQPQACWMRARSSAFLFLDMSNNMTTI